VFDPDGYLTALIAATYSENFQILKRLKAGAKRDDVDMLLAYAARLGHADIVQYLLALGAKPNDKTNVGSTALDDCLESFRYGTFRLRFYHTDYGRRSKASKYDVSDRRATVQLLRNFPKKPLCFWV
jgi:ankyrin repeat protein